MLIVALVLAVIGLAALVAAVVTSNELVAWVCIAASVLGVILLIVDAIRERQQRGADDTESGGATAGTGAVASDAVAYSADETPQSAYANFDAEYPENAVDEQYPDEVVSDDPESDMPSDDEPEFAESSEEAAIHPIDESLDEDGADGTVDDTVDDEAEAAEAADERRTR